MKDYIQHIFDYKHKLTKEKLEKLTRADIRMLFNALKTRDSKVNLKKNILILSTIVPDMVRDELYKILLNEKETAYIRILCASCLNSIYDDKAERIYLKLLRANDQPKDLNNKLIKGIGKFGTKRSLAVLKKLREIHPMNDILKLSTLLITSKYYLPNRLKFDTEPVVKFKNGKRQKIVFDYQRTYQAHQSEVYGLASSKESICYTCGSKDFTVLITNELYTKKRSYCTLVSVIQAKSSHDKSYYTKLLLFLDATDIRNKRILGFRTDGLLAYAGKIEKDGSFSVQSLKKFGSDQVHIDGRLFKDRVIIEEFYSSNKLTARKKPERVVL